MRLGLFAGVVVAFMLQGGCATPYQAAAWRLSGGYEDLRLGGGRFRVGFDGNRFTSERRSSEFALLRAAHLTVEEGSRYFLVVDERTSSAVSQYTTPKTTHITGTTTLSAGGASFSGTAHTVGGQTIVTAKPSTDMVIQILGDSDGRDIASYDAHTIVRSMRDKYGLPPDLSPESTLLGLGEIAVCGGAAAAADGPQPPLAIALAIPCVVLLVLDFADISFGAPVVR